MVAIIMYVFSAPDSSLSSPDEGGKGQETSEIGNDTVGE